jgi:hypothetical protein
MRALLDTILEALTAIKGAIPHLLDAFNVVMSAVEHVAIRLALLWFVLYGIYKTLAGH